ncbi:MAG: arginine--tRNA ligase [Ferrimicrobium sp.]
MRAIKETIRSIIAEELAVEASAVGVSGSLLGAFVIEVPAHVDHGDLSTNAAMVSARGLGCSPRELAQRLQARLEGRLQEVERIEVAGPGFLNFFLSTSVFHEPLRSLLRDGVADYGRGTLGAGERVQVEFVSANPTGPLHVGNGWLAVYGDSLCRLLVWSGYEVWREYYVNDTGGQIRTLGTSLLHVTKGEPVPEGGYQGDYIVELAGRYDGADDTIEAGSWAASEILAVIRESLERLDITFDEWYSQASIEESGAVEAVVDALRSKDAVYEADGAVWFGATSFGDSRDRVLRKENGDYTYLAGDIAYHYNKLVVRGFDRVIDVWGADHHGQVASLFAALVALGIERSRLEIELGQMVSLLEGGQALKFSKRRGTAVPLTWLMDELGADATRLLILSTSIDRQTQVDLVAARQQSMENPLYYMQYAHARIASVLRTALTRGYDIPDPAVTDLSCLEHPRERVLLIEILMLPEVIERATRERSPHKIVAWLQSVATAFHGMYYDCPILVEEPPLRDARLCLILATKVALQVAFGLVGVTPVDEM